MKHLLFITAFAFNVFLCLNTFEKRDDYSSPQHTLQGKPGTMEKVAAGREPVSYSELLKHKAAGLAKN